MAGSYLKGGVMDVLLRDIHHTRTACLFPGFWDIAVFLSLDFVAGGRVFTEK